TLRLPGARHPGPHAPALLHAEERRRAFGRARLPGRERHADGDAPRAGLPASRASTVSRGGEDARDRARARLAGTLRLSVRVPGGTRRMTPQLSIVIP